MKNARKAWPGGCTVSDATTMSGRTLYYDMKPGSGASLNMGLYTDEKCMQEYSGVNSNVEQVLGNFLTTQQGSGDSQDNYGYDDVLDYSGWSLQEALNNWESAMDAFRICQPCLAYDINNVGFNGGAEGSSYGTYDCDQDNNGGNDDYDGGGCVEDDFDCYDDAGYTNVNQCMKFRAKTYMDPATLRDVMLAQRQGTLVETLPLKGMQGPSIGFFRMAGNISITVIYGTVAILIFVYSVMYFRKAQKDIRWPAIDMKKPLVFA